ncbi:MAG: tyrosine-protein phosphatase [Chloroflexi bacterium]|nr:tyrosine-protein phosphatase [Chloroflexota bacterium]
MATRPTHGRQTRWRTLYRSDCLDRLDADGQIWLVDAGLRCIVDLCDNAEVVERPNVFATTTRAEVTYRRVPFWEVLRRPTRIRHGQLTATVGSSRIAAQAWPALSRR